MTSANKSLGKIHFPLKKLELLSATPRATLKRIFRALQTSRVLHISMNARWRMNQFLIDYLLDKKVHLRPLRIYENWGNPYQPRYRVMVAESIEMSAIFELDARWSVYYAHCIFCIALKLALTTPQFKRSDIKIEHNRLKIYSPIRRTNKSASLWYLF